MNYLLLLELWTSAWLCVCIRSYLVIFVFWFYLIALFFTLASFCPCLYILIYLKINLSFYLKLRIIYWAKFHMSLRLLSQSSEHMREEMVHSLVKRKNWQPICLSPTHPPTTTLPKPRIWCWLSWKFRHLCPWLRQCKVFNRAKSQRWKMNRG